jgi:hypothetical protein
MELRSHGARTLEGLFARVTAILAAHAPLLTQFVGRAERNANLRDAPQETWLCGCLAGVFPVRSQ